MYACVGRYREDAAEQCLPACGVVKHHKDEIHLDGDEAEANEQRDDDKKQSSIG